jgi:hypothetical protein
MLCPVLGALLLAACSLVEPVPPSASPAASGAGATSPRGSWVEDLAFSGDLVGSMGQVVAGDPNARSVCTGGRGAASGTWVLTLYGRVARNLYGVEVVVDDYRGPGTYPAPRASVQVYRPDGSAAWRTVQGDRATFSVDAGQQSGKLDATLTNLANDRSKLNVRGRWSCQT